jgi:hypothetical protein
MIAAAPGARPTTTSAIGKKVNAVIAPGRSARVLAGGLEEEFRLKGFAAMRAADFGLFGPAHRGVKPCLHCKQALLQALRGP